MGIRTRPRNGLSVCSGGGGLDLALMLAEPQYHSRCYIEIESYPQRVLIDAMDKGHLAQAPIFDDLKQFDPTPFKGCFDTLVGGYPCQPFSTAGKRKGIEDPRHLWPYIEAVIPELGPQLEWLFFENVANHLKEGGELVHRSLQKMGFTTSSRLLSAYEIGATQERKRLFIVAYRPCKRTGPGGLPVPAKAEDSWTHCGGGELERPDDANRRSSNTEGRDRVGTTPRQLTGGPGTSSNSLEGPSGITGRIHARQGRPRKRARDAGGGSIKLAGTERAGLERIVAERSDAERWKEQTRSLGLRRRTGIFVPAKNDMCGWYEELQHSFALAPAISIRHVKRLADYYAQAIEEGEMAEEKAKSELRRCAHGFSGRMGKLKLLGNAVVPLQGAHAWQTLAGSLGLEPFIFGEENDYQDMPTVQERVSSAENAEQILRERMPTLSIPNREGVCPDGLRHGTSGSDGGALGPEATNLGACPPQEPQQTRQSNKELGGYLSGGAYDPSQIEASQAEKVQRLRDDLHSGPTRPRTEQDLLEGMPIQTDFDKPEETSFEGWVIKMRLALSALPFHSGPWTWKPQSEAETEQLEMF